MIFLSTSLNLNTPLAFYILYSSGILYLPYRQFSYALSYFGIFYFAHWWSTICSGHTVPRAIGVAREVAFVTLRCHIMFDRYYCIDEGYSGSSWNLVIKCSNIDILLSCFDISQVDIIELASRS